MGRGWLGRRAGEQFLAICLAGNVFDLRAVAAPEGGAPETVRGPVQSPLLVFWTLGISFHNWQGNSCPTLAPDPRLWLPKATYKTNKALILGCATFRRHVVKRELTPKARKELVLGKEKTCPTF